MQRNLAPTPLAEAHQTVRLNVDTKDGISSIRISFTDQRLTAHGGMIVWSHFLHQRRFRQQQLYQLRVTHVHFLRLDLYSHLQSCNLAIFLKLNQDG